MAAEPSTPRPAATVILVREPFDVLLVQRNPEASFMPGVWVFPGGAVDAEDAGADDDAAHRACAIRELREEAGVELGQDTELLLYSRWITPEFVPIRFDTRFYIAAAPAGCEPQPDGAETVDAGWFGPRQALDRQAEGELELVFPTIKHLESLARFRSAAEAVENARARKVEPVLPRLTGEGKGRRVVLPEDWDR